MFGSEAPTSGGAELNSVGSIGGSRGVETVLLLKRLVGLPVTTVAKFWGKPCGYLSRKTLASDYSQMDCWGKSRNVSGAITGVCRSSGGLVT